MPGGRDGPGRSRKRHIAISFLCLRCQVSGNSRKFNESQGVSEEFPDVPVKGQKSPGGSKTWDTCSIPCDVTVKLLRDEKHSICGKKKNSFSLLTPLFPSSAVQKLCVCVCVCRPAAAVSVGVWTQHQEADEGRDGGTAKSLGPPQQSGKVELLLPLW